MSELKLCQGTKCHEYRTTDRIRGSKGDKHYETRKRSRFYYGNGNFCTLNCQNDWWSQFGTRAVDHFGRIHEPKRTMASGSWYKDYAWDRNNSGGRTRYNHYFINDLLGERRPITPQQYNDESFVRP